MSPLAARVEALLFAAGEPVTLRHLAQCCQATEAEARAALAELARGLEGHGIELCAVAGGHQLRTRADYADAVAALLQPRRAQLSRPALETLAIIAFRQPITRAGVDELRGVHSESALATLLERGLVHEVGRAEAPGRPILYGTTHHFLEHFGLRSLSDLKAIDLLGQAEAEGA